jgi:phenylacetate-CoA ligase
MKIYSSFLENCILPIGDFFVGSSYVKFLRNWRKIDTYSSEELSKIQLKRLTEVLQFTIKNIPYYKDLVLSPDRDTHSWLQQFPVLSKDDLRKNQDQLLSESKKGLVKIISSGSSGVRTEVFMNQTDISSLRAGNTHWWEWAGYRIGEPLLQTGITTKRSLFKKIKDVIFRTTYVNAFSLTNTQLDEICKGLSKGNQKFILGYASSINVIAEYALKNNFEINLESVISLGDKLFPHYRLHIEKAFQCKVYENYGSSEGFLVASQFDLDYLYINTPQVYLEILDDDNQPVEDGEMGHVVVTRLDNRAMPLIRYRLGDLCIKLPKEKYPKSRAFNYPLLERVVGRDTDIVILPDGKKLVVHSFTGVFEHIKEIKQFKIIQRNVNGIEIEYIPDIGFKIDILKEITIKLQEFIFQKDFVISYSRVKFIQRTKSGKPQIIESFLKK